MPAKPILSSVLSRTVARAVAPAVAAQNESLSLVRSVAPLVPKPKVTPYTRLLTKAAANPRVPVPAGLHPTLFTRRTFPQITSRPAGSTGPVTTPVVEQMALTPAASPEDTLTMPDDSSFSLVPDQSQNESSTLDLEGQDVPDWMSDAATDSPAAQDPTDAATPEPAGDQSDPLDELDDYENLAAGGDISQQELNTLKVDLAQRTGATPSTNWIPLILLGGLLAMSLSIPGRRGRRGF